MSAPFLLMSQTLTRRSPGKINLLLNVLGRRVDGFHELETVLLPIPVADELTVGRIPKPGVRLTCSQPALPTDSRNLVFRAAEMALRANKESMNPDLAAAYGQLARDYYTDLAQLSQNKQPARPKVVGRPAAYRPRYLRRDTHITTS